MVTKPSRGKRKVGKVGSKGNSSKVMLGVAQTLVWSSASYVVSGTLYMRKATGAAAESWARAGGAILMSDVEVCHTTQSMPFIICRIAAIFSWTTSWSALFAMKLKMRARSFGLLTAPSHVAMTIGSMSSSSCVLCLRCVWGNPLGGLVVWGGKVL